jgi:hypothetical protein
MDRVIIMENFITKTFYFRYFFNQKNSRWQGVLNVPNSFEDERCYQCLRFLKVFNVAGFSLTARMLLDVRSCLCCLVLALFRSGKLSSFLTLSKKEPT